MIRMRTMYSVHAIIGVYTPCVFCAKTCLQMAHSTAEALCSESPCQAVDGRNMTTFSSCTVLQPNSGLNACLLVKKRCYSDLCMGEAQSSPHHLQCCCRVRSLDCICRSRRLLGRTCCRLGSKAWGCQLPSHQGPPQNLPPHSPFLTSTACLMAQMLQTVRMRRAALLRMRSLQLRSMLIGTILCRCPNCHIPCWAADLSHSVAKYMLTSH